MSNLGLHKFCEEHGINFISAKVGDRYVLEILNQEGYSFGGEQSGHVIMRHHATTGDGQLTAVALLSHIKESKKNLSELSSVMKKYPQYMVNIETTQSGKVAFFTDEDIKSILNDAEKKIGDSGRLVVRPSGTEPLIRIMAEGECESEITEIVNDTAKKISEKLKNY